MGEIARVRWSSPPPTEIDEELVVDDDGTAWLAVRTARDGTPVIGTFAIPVSPDDRAALDGLRLEVNLPHPVDEPGLPAAERLARAAREHPVATATFYAALTPDATVVLQAVGGGTEPAQFQLDPDSVVVHLEENGVEVGWQPMKRLGTGFVSPEPAGLGGVGRPAVIKPGEYGGIALSGAETAGGTAIAIEVTGQLRDARPEQPAYRRFSVRTAPVARS